MESLSSFCKHTEFEVLKTFFCFPLKCFQIGFFTGISGAFKHDWNSVQHHSSDLHVLLETLFNCKLITENNGTL